jgi:hypothetical protein
MTDNIVNVENEIDAEFEAMKEENYREVTIKELEDKIAGMKADRDKKCKAAREQLVDTLKVTVDKYRTATGTAEALRVLRFVVGNDEVNLAWANRLAWDMAVEADKIRKKAEKLAYAEMDNLCDGFYEKEFKLAYPKTDNDMDYGPIETDHLYQLAFEMMRIDLCRNVGGAAEDMAEFIKRVSKDINETGEELKKLKAENKAS